ncbi:serine/threonine-protein phosphatase CPPED1 isoform X3 [Xiphophorus hellerii]|uniref:serine/threonine-protein phosphatase CPPED1 isoform X3 n=1 Tax=Xiphophorus hellerii TaxID=8084 RepID=UPI0013B40279|nr:serine/threonine-protein phosphatase CPPED1 isoform X3 [Xiphophorus hellerii]
MADTEEMFLRAKHRTFSGLTEEAERQWTGPFCFVQAADPQLGLMKAWRIGDAVGGGDEWEEEVALTKQAVAGVNQLRPRPRFMVLCGDLVHAMPGVTAVFSGHYHRNAGGCHDGLDMVVTSAIGCQLGDDTHGVRLVAVTANAVVHRYYSLEQLGQRGVDEELRKMLQAC